MTATPSIVWFRRDLRLADNPALAAAAATGRPIVPLYILDDSAAAWRPGAASRWWLHHSLQALAADLAVRGTPLVLRHGRAAETLARLAAETGARAVYVNRCFEADAMADDDAIAATLAGRRIDLQRSGAALLFEPSAIASKAGTPYKIFSQFWAACLAAPEPPAPQPAPARLVPHQHVIDSEPLASWQLVPRAPDWAGGLRAAWTPGEAGAQARLAAFIDGAIDGYAVNRDRPGVAGTSHLSPHLHFGEIGPRQVWHAIRAAVGPGEDSTRFLAELGWREFSHHTLVHFPRLPDHNLRPAFDRFPWAPDAASLRAWQRGQTGYPIVDAGMRELWRTGWMHNRVRMIVASFLVKHLLQPWQTGAAWFWDTLVDADLANNAANWQWVAGSGTDAAPYFRIFNPVLQGEKFDASGDYIRGNVPALARLPARWIHKPWQAPADVLAAAGVVLGRDYPHPVVDHAAARARALRAFAALKQPVATARPDALD
jgi:deoxyribodipyrimidine photo-lyase